MGVVKLDLSDRSIANQVHAVQVAAYQVEAALIGSAEIPPLVETLDEMVEAPLSWRGIVDGDRVVAAMALSHDGSSVDIDRLVVAPDAMRRGLATELIETLDGVAQVTVSTGKLNHPARRLYEALGFESVAESEPVNGLPVSHYVRTTDG